MRIPLPDAKGREGSLRWHLQGLLPGADLSGIAARTEGWSGAALEQIVQQARRKARRARRALSLDDLLSELPPLVPLPEALRRKMAIHEAGHAVGLAVDAGEIISVSISSTALPSEAEQDG